MANIFRNGKLYRFVDAKAYVKRLAKGKAAQIRAEKDACVLARPAVQGEIIPVFTKNGYLEAVERGVSGNIVVTRCDLSARPIVDSFGHVNTWQMSAETFEEMYDSAGMRPEDGLTRPKGGVQQFIQADDDVAIMVPWGEDGALIPETIDRDSWLNITDDEDIYGVATEEFRETYHIIEWL